MLNHCQNLRARCAFEFVNPETGRKIQVKAGAVFWVTSSPLTQSLESCVRIDRKGKGAISHGYAWAESDLREYFELI